MRLPLAFIASTFALSAIAAEPALCDRAGLLAVIDVAGQQMWLVQYGGIAGHVQWFGPVAASPELFAGCPEVSQGAPARAEAQERRKAKTRPPGSL